MAAPRIAALALSLCACAPCAAQQLAQRSLVDLSLEELANIPVTSVTRSPQRVSQAPASVYVITNADIRRSGATSLPDALRLAPNLLVAQINAHDYAIASSRGFLSNLGTKLLVMVDGRSIYTPLFAGVIWDAQDVMLEDIDRIEVISGPGGTTWGTNAVTGVINIVTKAAADTQGVLASGYAGGRGDGVAARYGTALGSGHVRAYAKHFDRESFTRSDGLPARDGGRREQAGFRGDWHAGGDAWTLQGDVYQGDRLEPAGQREVSGANVLGRWTRTLAGGAAATVQGYFDRSERDQARTFIETLDIFDIEARYTGAPAGRHRFTLGGGYRHADDRTGSDFGPSLVPADRQLDWLNVFLQDEIALRPDLVLTLGARAEENDYTGWETMPSARLAWQPTPARLVWTALSRAVRSPSRIDREFAALALGPDFESEVSDVLEVGYRAQPSPRASYSLTAFAHEHDDLRGVEPTPQGLRIQNRVEARTRGLEGWGALQATPAWRLSGGFVLLDQDIDREPGSFANAIGEARDPSHRWILRSRHDLGERLALDLIVRRMGKIPNHNVPSYTALDAALGWTVRPGVTLAVAGQNLNDPGHPEFGVAATRVEVPRSVFARVTLDF
jgi:iron complex outermembrane receptor protein